jgi:hypothetical protein
MRLANLKAKQLKEYSELRAERQGQQEFLYRQAPSRGLDPNRCLSHFFIFEEAEKLCVSGYQVGSPTPAVAGPAIRRSA